MTNATLLDRLGGDSLIPLLSASYFDELIEDKTIGKYFRRFPSQETLTRQGQVFRSCFGATDGSSELVDLFFSTHTRLVGRMQGDLFDCILDCLRRALQTFQVDNELIDEAVQAMEPLRSKIMVTMKSVPGKPS